MEWEPGISCVIYLPMRWYEKVKQPVDDAFTGIRRWQETWQRQVCSRTEANVGLVGMLVTNFLFQKSHCIFFPCWFLLQSRVP